MEPVDPPQILEPGAGETIRPGYEIKVGRTELVMTESLYAPGQAGPDPHIHRHHADAFWVLEGRLLVQIGSDDHFVDAGGFALAPPEVVHSFRNPGPGPARFLNIHAPGMGFDEYVRSGYEFDFDQEDPPADGGRPANDAIVLAAGEGRRLTLGESSVTIKAGSGDALGSFALMELDFAPGMPTPRLHRHERMTDSFYVLEGELPVQVGDRSESLPPGSYAYVPPGNAHTFSGLSGRVRALNLMAPAGLERYLEEVAALEAPPTEAQMAEFASRYDFRAV